MTWRWTGPLAILVVLSLGDGALAQDAPIVGIELVQVKDTSRSTEFIGRVEAVNAVDILTRIDGFLENRFFNEGSAVQKDQDLFLIERSSYEITLAEAQAALVSAKATFVDADRQLQRNRSLINRQTIAQSILEQSETALETARSTVMSAEARVRQAELNLSYTRIKSPIDGRIGTAAFSVGSFVGTSSGALARVVQMDPIRVVFSVSDRTILDLRAAAGGLSKDALAKQFRTGLRLSNGSQYDEAGEIEYFENQIDAQTGTIAVRVLFHNSQSLLVPGQFVTVLVQELKQNLRPVVPVGAVQQDREGKFVFVVDAESKVETRRITVSTQKGRNWIVDDGLKGGEKLVVEGIQNASPGTVVRVTEVSDPLEDPSSSGFTPSLPGAKQ
ncbi:membrane fusion protein (multidrug efflux system) [Phyllobacterium sp. 1468]|uniref:efflux RND transporter periplasmic adaptor subunit n=1 Tax=Phyllobacterium sp. 1468 TaxID=2817759 RepID=UPI0028665DAC|nr:efflux RND transporter periplasmic adaptor subunit [Phyllobacterium sp. 1468]MDR6635933.1 membrane fusion protein (multidrug efflux system) [Phyllobacterium sp. 1468]